jgi:hypothetical protein
VGRETNKQRRQKNAVTAREKASLARAEQQRADQRRRALTILSSVVAVALVLGVIGFFALNSHSHKKQTASGNRVAATPSVVKEVTAVTPATLQTVGAGTATVLPKKISDPALTSGGKPELLFVGAEFCPFCAAERWPMIQAMSRFGTFSNLNEISSSSTDTDPNTPTFSFYKSHYTSKYFTFVPVENEDRNHNTLVNMTAAQNKIFSKYTDGYPFLYFGGKYVETSESYDPALLAGLTQAQVASQLNDPTSKVAKAIDGSANAITAAICSMTNNQPASACLVPEVTNLQSQLNA